MVEHAFDTGAPAVLLVDLAEASVAAMNPAARRLAGGLPAPVPVQEWLRAVAAEGGLAGAAGDGWGHLRSALRGEPVHAPLAGGAGGLAVVGVPLEEQPKTSGTQGRAVVALVPLAVPTDAADAPAAAAGGAPAAGGLSAQARAAVPRAMAATSRSFTLASNDDPDLPLVWVNSAFCTMTGYTPEEALGRNCRFLQGTGTDRSEVARLRAAVQAGRDVTVVLRNYRKDGTAFWNEVSVSPVPSPNGTTSHFVGVQTDVTERVEAARLREVALAAERAARDDAEAARAEAETARRRVEQLGARLALLAEATTVLTGTLDVDDALDRLARLVVPELADWVVIHVPGEQGRFARRIITRHRDGRAGLLDRYRELLPEAAPSEGPLRALLLGDRVELVRRMPTVPPERVSAVERELWAVCEALGMTSLETVPLTARGGTVGAMMLVHGPSGRTFSNADLALAADLGRRAGLAVDNAQLYTREHATAVTLQRSLLPELPVIPGLEMAAEYLPAGQESSVGGDWWDVFALPDGATGLAVGDVMGHDITAAAAMGQLRSVLRTCAWAGDRPALVLDRMDQLVQGFDMAQLATCFFARLDRDRGAGAPPAAGRARLSWSNAGHLPPIVQAPDGAARLLVGGQSVPIGVPTTQARPDGATTLEAGSTLLLYTDGLVETRGSDIEQDLRDLLALVAVHPPDDGPKPLLSALLETVDTLQDDVALLAVHLIPPELDQL